MKLSMRGWFVVGVFAALVALVVLGAPQLNAQEPAAASGQLTEESLGNLLGAMGLKPKQEEKRFDFAFKAVHQGEEWTLSMSAVLSQNGESIWVMAWLDELPRSAAEVPRTALLRLLSQNDRLGKGKFFAYIASNRRFVLQRVIPNENVTTATFAGVLKDLGISVIQTYPHWAVAGWTNKPGTSEGAGESGRGQSAPSARSQRTVPRNATRSGAAPRR